MWQVGARFVPAYDIEHGPTPAERQCLFPIYYSDTIGLPHVKGVEGRDLRA
jgi:hypothetical protein